MKTRTLLLLALGCGVAILLAGGVLFVQLAGRDDPEPPAPIGRPVAVGDMTVTVEGSTETRGVLTVAVVLGGVEDPDGASGFRLIASGRPAVPDDEGTDACGATTTSPTGCDLRFDVSTADGTSRVLFYRRGDDQARWELGTP
jgi:hypothetical protein